MNKSRDLNILNCLETYSDIKALPAIIDGKCDSSTCSTLTTEMSAVKSCLNDPTSTACKGIYFITYV